MSRPKNPNAKPVKICMNFTPQIAEALRTLAAAHGKTMTDILQRGVALQAHIDQATKDGAGLFIITPTGEKTQVLLNV